MKKINPLVLFFGIFILLIAGTYFLQQKNAAAPGAYDQFAECLGDSGATFYGAFWCPHCRDQKSMFGNSASKLPYVECSTPDKQGQTEVCIEAGIKSYPTWEFKDGTRKSGVLPLSELADRTGCELPQ